MLIGMEVGIIGAMEEEVEFLRSEMQDRDERIIGGATYYTGTLAGKSAVVVQCGIGKVAAAISTGVLIHEYDPKAIINTGSAGGTDKNLEVGDVVIGTEILHHDVNVTAFGYKPGQLPGMPARFKADQDLVAVAEKASEKFADLRVTRGLIGTGDSFMNDPRRIAAVVEQFEGLTAVEMEGAAIAQTCYMFGLPFVIIRSISDIAGKESPVSFQDFLSLASRNSGKLVIEMLKHL